MLRSNEKEKKEENGEILQHRHERVIYRSMYIKQCNIHSRFKEFPYTCVGIASEIIQGKWGKSGKNEENTCIKLTKLEKNCS